MTNQDTVWNDERRVTLLKARWLEGYSATQIANELQEFYPLSGGAFISRSAVIGKIHRLGLTRSIVTPTKRHATFPRSVKREANTFVPRIVEVEKPPEVIGPLNDFPPVDCCRHTDDHPAIQDFRFCGQPVFVKTVKGQEVKMSECEYHYRRNHQRPQGAETVPTNENGLSPDELALPPIVSNYGHRKRKHAA